MRYSEEQSRTIQYFLNTAKTIAIVGLSSKSGRPSFQVAHYLQKAGYTIIPVNPGQARILGQPCYPSLTAVPGPVDIVDIFRKSDHVLSVVKEAVQVQARMVWMQSGIINEEAADLAKRSGLTVVMDRCLKTDHMNFILS